MQEEIFNIITNKDSISWKTLIFEVIKQNKMDPWDVDISKLSKSYMKIINKIQEFDFIIGGKVIIAASFLLRLKSTKLVDEDLMEFDRLIAETQRTEEEFMGEFYGDLEGDYDVAPEISTDQPVLYPRTPQPRKRKVSVYDLVNALSKAMEVHERKVLREMETPMIAPEKKKDISEVITDIYKRILSFFKGKPQSRLTLRNIVPSENREDIIQTFVPLLHLSHVSHKKIDLTQKKHFGEIEISLPKV